MATASETGGLWELAGELGSSWKEIARNLGFTDSQLHRLIDDVPNDSHERCYQMLLKWQKKTHQSHREGQLRNAFETAHRLDLIHLGTRVTGLSSYRNHSNRFQVILFKLHFYFAVSLFAFLHVT